MRGGFAFPIRSGQDVLGVIELFTRNVAEPDPSLLDAMTALGAQIGEFMRRSDAERALRESEEQHRLLVETARDAIVTTTEQSVIVFANAAASRIFGYAVDEMVGQALTMLIPERFREGHREGMARYLETGERRIPWDGIELPRPAPRRGEIALEVSFAELRRNGERFFTGTMRDITDRKLAEAASLAREEQFRTLANSIPQLAWMADESGYIFWYNQRWYEYTGTAPADMEGWGWQSVHDPEVLPEVMERWQASLAAGEPFDMVFPLRGADGVFRPFLTRVLPVHDAEGTITRWFGTNTDISEQRETEARQKFLAEASAMLASSLDYETTLREVAHLAVPTLAEWCAVDLLEEGGEIRRVAVAHPDPEREAIAHELQRRYPPAPDAPTGVPEVIRTGQPELVPEIPADLLEAAAVDAEHLRLLRALELRSYLIVPLTARGRRLGALTLVQAESGRRFSAEDLDFAGALAQRAAIAVDNARLFRAAEEARAQTEAILESITDAFFAMDGQWRITYINSEARRLFALPDTELIGRQLWELFPGQEDSVYWREYRRALREQTPLHFEASAGDGDIWYDYHVYPSADGLSVYFRDISREKRAEFEVRASEQRWRFLADSIPQQVWTADAGGQLDYVNRVVAQYFGRTAEDVIGDGWQAVVHPDDLPDVVERWTASVQSGRPYEVEFRLRRADGEHRWHIGRAEALQDPGGDVQRWFGTNTDVHDRKRLEAEREKALREVETQRRRLEQVFTEAPAVMALYSGPEQVITWVNPLWEQTVGKPGCWEGRSGRCSRVRRQRALRDPGPSLRDGRSLCEPRGARATGPPRHRRGRGDALEPGVAPA